MLWKTGLIVGLERSQTFQPFPPYNRPIDGMAVCPNPELKKCQINFRKIPQNPVEVRKAEIISSTMELN